MSKALLFAADVEVDGERVQQQAYLAEQGAKSTWICEVRSFDHEPCVRAQCEFTVEPEGYRSLDILWRNPESTMSVRLLRTAANQMRVLARDNEEGIAIIDQDGGIAYFDGPNPLFDYVNAILLMGLRDGERRIAIVNVLQVATARVIQAPYTFHRAGSTIRIQKDLGEVVEAELVLDEDGMGISSYRTGDQEYSFLQ